jgi:hypothetical protein
VLWRNTLFTLSATHWSAELEEKLRTISICSRSTTHFPSTTFAPTRALACDLVDITAALPLDSSQYVSLTQRKELAGRYICCPIRRRYRQQCHSLLLVEVAKDAPLTLQTGKDGSDVNQWPQRPHYRPPARGRCLPIPRDEPLSQPILSPGNTTRFWCVNQWTNASVP